MGGLVNWNGVERWKLTPAAPNAQAAGEFAEQLHATQAEIARTEFNRPEPIPEPVPGSDEEITALETKLNRKRQELSDFLEHTRFDALQSELPTLRGRALVSARGALDGWRPDVEKLRGELADLSAQHRDLIAKRKERDRERLRSAHCCV
jgi:predicted  nucleic acid-binding Zn-ribbon protein